MLFSAFSSVKLFERFCVDKDGWKDAQLVKSYNNNNCVAFDAKPWLLFGQYFQQF